MQLERLVGAERLGSYLEACAGNHAAALVLYRWNAAARAAFWQPLGHLEVGLRNALNESLKRRHAVHCRPGSWLDDPDEELDAGTRRAIAVARRRVLRKG